MIGVFDSGVGGMTVAKAIEDLCPQLPLVYFGDLARSPYGSKSPEVITTCCCRNIDFLIQQGATVVVIACNSAAATAAETLRQQYQLPIIDVVTATVEKAAQVSRAGRIGIIGTRATIRSKIYEERLTNIRPNCRIASQACPLLVSLVEEDWLGKQETKMILRRYLSPLRQQQVDTLILGCTHYPLLSTLIQPRIGTKVQLVDSSAEAARHLKEFLDKNPEIGSNMMQQEQPSRFFVSDNTGPVQRLADRIFGRSIYLEKVDV
jgi:glutamate racemase